MSPMLSSEVWEVHLKGTVWGSRGVKSGVAVRRLMSLILSALAKQNYVLCAAIDASGKDSSKDTMYLRREEGPVSEVPTQFFSMAYVPSPASSRSSTFSPADCFTRISVVDRAVSKTTTRSG